MSHPFAKPVPYRIFHPPLCINPPFLKENYSFSKYYFEKNFCSDKNETEKTKTVELESSFSMVFKSSKRKKAKNGFSAVSHCIVYVFCCVTLNLDFEFPVKC